MVRAVSAKNFRSFALNTLFAGVGGATFYAANPPIACWPLSFFSLALLFLISLHARPKSAFLFGWIWGAFYFYLLFDWAEIAASLLAARLALAAIEALFIGLCTSLWALLYRRLLPLNFSAPPWQKLLLLAGGDSLLWVATEQLRSAVPYGGMPWGNTAFIFVDAPLLHLAPWGSIQLVSFTAVFIGILLGYALKQLREKQIFRSGRAVVGAVLLLVLPLLVPSGAVATQNLRIGIVQGNVPDVAKLGPGESRALIVTKNHLQATYLIADQNPDLVLWPESASDRNFRRDYAAGKMVEKAVAAIAPAPLLLGTQNYFSNVRTNDYVAIDESGIIDSYSKQHPVPFGEYLPLRNFISRFVPAAEEISTDMVPGSAPAQLQVKIPARANHSAQMIQIGTPICFEVAYTNIVAQAAQNSQLLVVPTNNASFGNSGEPFQQFAMSRFRAAEHQKSTLQVSTSGVSGIIAPSGKVIYQSKLGVSAARIQEIALNSHVTLATKSYKIRTIITYLGGVALLFYIVFTPERWRLRKASRKNN